jgi:hypothetical protein
MSRRRARGESHGAIEGSLCDHPARKLLDLCQRHQLTGVLQIMSWGRSGRIRMRGGTIAAAAYGALDGDAAVAELLSLRDGLFELRQDLPSLPAAGRGAERASVSALMEQCRERACSCRIEVLSRGQRAVLVYRAGALERAEIDGKPLVDTTYAAAALEPFEHGQVQIQALPFSLHEHAAAPQSAMSAADSRPVLASPARPTPARPPRPTPASPAQTLPARPPRPTPAAPARPVVRPEGYPPLQRMPGPGPGPVPPRQPVATPPPLPVVAGPRAHGATAGELRPWPGNPGISDTAADTRYALVSRRGLAVPALLAVFVLSLVLIISFVALQQ